MVFEEQISTLQNSKGTKMVLKTAYVYFMNIIVEKLRKVNYRWKQFIILNKEVWKAVKKMNIDSMK